MTKIIPLIKTLSFTLIPKNLYRNRYSELYQPWLELINSHAGQKTFSCLQKLKFFHVLRLAYGSLTCYLELNAAYFSSLIPVVFVWSLSFSVYFPMCCKLKGQIRLVPWGLLCLSILLLVFLVYLVVLGFLHAYHHQCFCIINKPP